MCEQLLGGTGEDEQSQGVLTSFATSSLEAGGKGGEANKKKLTKKQKLLRQRQEDLNRKFRELDLLEGFLLRYVHKRPKGIEMLKDLHDVLISSSRRALGHNSAASSASTAKDSNGNVTMSKADAAVRQTEGILAQRVAKLLSRSLKQVCRSTIVEELCKYHTADEWAEQAQKILAQGFTARVSGAGARPLEAGALLLYLFCAAHDAVVSQEDGGKGGSSWSLAEKMLTSALADWSSNKDGDRWCKVVFQTFVSRVPEVLLRLPWAAQVRATKKSFVQRAQLSFICNHLLQDLPNKMPVAAVGQLAADFADACADVLKSSTTTETTTATSKDAAADATANAQGGGQHQKLRREALRGLKVALKLKRRDSSSPLTTAAAQSISAAVTQVRDELSAKQQRGDVYHSCLYVLRSLTSTEDKVQSAAEKRPPTAQSREAPSNKRRKALDEVSKNAAMAG